MKILQKDIDEIVENCRSVAPLLESGTILITGGTGFIGRWLVSAFHELLERKLINNDVLLLVRDRDSAHKKFRFSLNKKINFIQSAQFLDGSPLQIYPEIRYVIHAAGPSSNSGIFSNEDIFKIKELTQSIIQYSKKLKQPPNVIHLSSGAVYGEEARKMKIISESQPLLPAYQVNAYGKMKQEIERIIEDATCQGIIQGANPRLFAFSGYGTILDGRYAIGNFMSDALIRNSIQVKGNSLTTRSYLYITDLVELIFSILVAPSIEKLHFGSAAPITMRELALKIASVFGQLDVDFVGEDKEVNHYVPSVINTLEKLQVPERIGLEEGIIRWKKTLKMN